MPVKPQAHILMKNIIGLFYKICVVRDMRNSFN